MSTTERDIRQLHTEMEHVLNDAEHFLSDLRAQKHTHRVVKKDVVHLKEHLQRLIMHLNALEGVGAG